MAQVYKILTGKDKVQKDCLFEQIKNNGIVTRGDADPLKPGPVEGQTRLAQELFDTTCSRTLEQTIQERLQELPTGTGARCLVGTCKKTLHRDGILHKRRRHSPHGPIWTDGS